MIATSVCLLALLPFCLFFIGLLWFSDDLDAARHTIACPCGRRDMRCLVSGPDESERIRRLLAANCPWCTPAPARPTQPKGVDVHA